MSLVCAVTGIESPVAIALTEVPSDRRAPGSAGKFSLLAGIAVNVLLGVVELYNSADTMPGLSRVTAAATLKNAAIDVIVPSRGTVNAIFRSTVAPPVK